MIEQQKYLLCCIVWGQFIKKSLFTSDSLWLGRTMYFWKLLLWQEIWDTGKQNWSNWPGQTKITLKFKSHNLSFSHSDVWLKMAYVFWKLLLRQEICTLGSKIGAIDKNHSQIKVTQSHFVTLSYDWNKMAYVFLKAFVKMRNLRHWKEKLEQFTSSVKNHSQIQFTQSHFLTLSDVWHTMAYVFLKAFVKTRNLRRWKTKLEQLTSSDKNHSHI